MNGFEVIAHHFSSGVYAKQVIIKEGFEILSHKHTFDHLSILSSGIAIVEVDGESQTYYAPAVIEIKAGEVHKIEAINGPAVWFCIHGTDGEYDESNIDDVLIQEK